METCILDCLLISKSVKWAPKLTDTALDFVSGNEFFDKPWRSFNVEKCQNKWKWSWLKQKDGWIICLVPEITIHAFFDWWFQEDCSLWYIDLHRETSPWNGLWRQRETLVFIMWCSLFYRTCIRRIIDSELLYCTRQTCFTKEHPREW